MAEKIISSLIYGEHAIPKKQKPWQLRILLPILIGLLIIAAAFAVYKFANYREEGSVSRFFSEIRNGNYDRAYADWDLEGGHYTMKDFMEDWGKDGYYGKTIDSARIYDSNSAGLSVIVYFKLNGFKAPIALLVDKESLKISFSAGKNKYVRTKNED
jgi:hypothetical protein